MQLKNTADLEILESLGTERSNTWLTNDWLTRWINWSCVNDKYTIFYEAKTGLAKGYIIWADINSESLIQLVRYKKYPTYRYEWNEGRITLILDIFTVSGVLAEEVNQIKKFVRSRKLIVFVRDGELKIFKRRRKLYVEKNNNPLVRPQIMSVDKCSSGH